MVIVSEFVEGSSSSSSTRGPTYDVFLSFRGTDTRNNFTGHLHKALLDANISTFLDDDETESGGDLKPELERAIKASRASIIVLSRNYANSSSCLNELLLILEQHRTRNHIVLPIFYHVEPTHVRNQTSTFGDATAQQQQKMERETYADKTSREKLDRWTIAIREVADIKGMAVADRLESEFVEEVVQHIYRIVPRSSRFPLPQLIGMEDPINFVTSWLEGASSDTGDILTILGMGGIGKTSLAKYVYGLHSHEFDTSSFIEDISRRCNELFNTSNVAKDVIPSSEKFNGLLNLQKQLYYDITGQTPIQKLDVPEYMTSEIEVLVATRKVFLVLDDINSHDQLDALLGSKGYHPGSKIIITTKDASLTESCALFETKVKPKHVKHMLQGLRQADSRKLLCFHAFRCENPKAGYEKVLEKLVKYCQGHPLALVVLGKSLYNHDVAYWEGCIKGLNKQKDLDINSVLRKDFDSLPFEDDKQLFKHIACFFVGMDINVTQTILEACGKNKISAGIKNLIDRCLISIGRNNKLQMHQLLQQMGRFVVRQESHYKPYMLSRVWCHEESCNVLKHKKGTEHVLGLTLNTKKLEDEKLHGSFEFNTDALSKMVNLMLLQLNYVQIHGSYKNFPKKLIWLCLHGFPLKSIPSNLPMEKLVALDMSDSDIESFGGSYSNPQRSKMRQKLTKWFSKDKRLLGSLKILNLSYCKRLHSLGGFDGLPALERLTVSNCGGLLKVSESIGKCRELVLIDLSYCDKLKKLPRNIVMLQKLRTLLLDGCDLGKSRDEIGNMDSSKKLKATKYTKPSLYSILKTIPSDMYFSKKLKATKYKVLYELFSKTTPSDMKFFTNFFPRYLKSVSLVDNKLFNESFPVDFSGLSMLKDLCLDGNPIVSMPNCVRTLHSLELLSLSNCKWLVSVEHPPLTLKELILHFDYKPFLRKVVFDPEMSPLKFSVDLSVFIPLLFEIEGMVKIQPMAGVEEKLLVSLGWTNMFSKGSNEFEIQMYYEYGIFSTIYVGKEMPNWIRHRSWGQSISFTIPSSPNKLTGLNFCSMQTFLYLKKGFFDLPVITITNVTKNRTWLYKHCIGSISVAEKCLIFLSHWMFGKNELEAGDHVTITTVTEKVDQRTEECGVSLVYDDGEKMDEEEDVLGYYKSWKHIIGGDLSPFQTTTGEYILNTTLFALTGNEAVKPYYSNFDRRQRQLLDIVPYNSDRS